MRKQVGASGQIVLGTEYAGRLYEVIVHPGDRLELIPIAATPVETAREQAVEAADSWLPPGGYEHCTQWALDNREALEQYARHIEQEGTAAEQLQRFLTEHPDAPDDGHGKI